MLDERELWAGPWLPICLCTEADLWQFSKVIPVPTSGNPQLTSWHKDEVFLARSLASTKVCHFHSGLFSAKPQGLVLHWQPQELYGFLDSARTVLISLSLFLTIKSDSRNSIRWGLHEGWEVLPRFLILWICVWSVSLSEGSPLRCPALSSPLAELAWAPCTVPKKQDLGSFSSHSLQGCS